MRRLVAVLALCVVVPGIAPADDLISVIFGSTADTKAKETKLPQGSHEVTKTIPIKGQAVKGVKLQTLAVGPDGNVYALLGSDRYGAKMDAGEVQVYTPAGEMVKSWKVGFQSSAINCAPDGTVFVSGDGKIAVFDATGSLKSEAELPFVKTILSDSDKLRKKAEETQKAEIASHEETIKETKSQIEELQKKDEEKRTKQEKAQLKQFEAMVKSYETMLERERKKKPEDYVKQIATRIKVINAVAATEKDVYVVCGELTGYGFAVWRMDRELQNPKQVMKGLRGCCGQMDIQAVGDELIVAQNCEHNVGRYSRDGKKLGTFGKRGRESEPDCFGGCCNPMNVRAIGGKVYTAESEGIVRAFSADGKPEGLVGAVKISGGCKNVAVAATPDGSTIWFCDQPGSKIHVMTKRSVAAKKAE